MSKQKKIKHSDNHKASKIVVKNSDSSENLKVVWLFDRVDRSGQFAFDINREDFDHKNFLDKIILYSSMTWAEVRRQTHDNGKSKRHYIGREIEKLSQSAKSRIIFLKLKEETDSIYSFAFSNKLRIIGIRDREKFHILWYDAYHEVYSSSK